MKPFEAALEGRGERIGFTRTDNQHFAGGCVYSAAADGRHRGPAVPRILGGAIVAIGVSMLVSLTTTPMMCAYLLKEHEEHGWMYRTSERGFNWVVDMYGRV